MNRPAPIGPDPTLLFLDHVRLMEAADLASLQALYTEDAFYYDPMSGKLDGREQIAPYLESIGHYFDSLAVVVLNAWRLNNTATVEWVQTTTRGHVETTMRGVSFLTERDGMLCEHRDYFSLGRPEAAEETRRHFRLPG